VAVRSDGPGKGAAFDVRLPLGRALIRRPDRSEMPSSELPKVDLSDHFVLVVDDDETTRDLMVTLLSQCGAQARAVGNAREALQEFEAAVPGLVVADIGMPGEDGLSMMRRIRQRSPARGGLVRAIAISAYARPEDRQAALAAGYDDFLAKPAMPADVVRAVDRWLARPPRSMPGRRRVRGAARSPTPADQTR